MMLDVRNVLYITTCSILIINMSFGSQSSNSCPNTPAPLKRTQKTFFLNNDETSSQSDSSCLLSFQTQVSNLNNKTSEGSDERSSSQDSMNEARITSSNNSAQEAPIDIIKHLHKKMSQLHLRINEIPQKPLDADQESDLENNSPNHFTEKQIFSMLYIR